jgi:hypothetical protein
MSHDVVDGELPVLQQRGALQEICKTRDTLREIEEWAGGLQKRIIG